MKSNIRKRVLYKSTLYRGSPQQVPIKNTGLQDQVPRDRLIDDTCIRAAIKSTTSKLYDKGTLGLMFIDGTLSIHSTSQIC